MDPLSLTVGIASLLTTVIKTSISITTFVRTVRGARKDLEHVTRELSSLQLSLSMLSEDCEEIELPASLEGNLRNVLKNCEVVVSEIERTLQKMKDGSTLAKRIEWSISAQSEIDKLRSNLEAHKASLDITLEAISMSVFRTECNVAFVLTILSIHLKSVKNDSSQIIETSEATLENTELILEKMAQMELDMISLRTRTSVKTSGSEAEQLKSLLDACHDGIKTTHPHLLPMGRMSCLLMT